MQHQAALRAGHVPIGHQHLEVGRRANRAPPAVSQPASPGLERSATCCAGQQRAHDRLRGGRVAHRPAGRRLVEREIEADVARGRDRGLAAQRPRRSPAPAGWRRDGRRAAARRSCRRRRRATTGGSAPLVAEQRRQDADQDAGGAERDDRPRRGVQRAQARRDRHRAARRPGASRARRVQARAPAAAPAIRGATAGGRSAPSTTIAGLAVNARALRGSRISAK